MRGMLATAVEPRAATSSGTSRQPAGSRPSARHASSTTFRSHGSRRKHIARPAPARPGERGRERQQHARAVAGDAVGSPRAAVRDGGQAGERAIEQLPRGAAASVGDEADATGVALEGAIVEKGVRAQRSPAFRVRERLDEPPAGVSVASPAEAGGSRLARGRRDDRERANDRREEFPVRAYASHR